MFGRATFVKTLKAAAGMFLMLLLFPIFLIFLFKWIAPPMSSFMVQKKVELLFSDAADTTIYHRWADYEKISENMKIAVVAAEDQKFPDHFGFDFESIRKALKYNERHERVRGASTITQQVAKNLFLWPGRSFPRKGLEAYLTMLIELIWSKQRILEVYLNIAEMGDRIYGVEAAANIYFNRSASQLNRDQAALLSAVLPNPARYSVRKPSPYVRHRKSWILHQISRLGGIQYIGNL